MFGQNDLSEIPPLIPIHKKKYEKVAQKTPENKETVTIDINDQPSRKKSDEEKDNVKTQHPQKKKEPSEQMLKKIEKKFNEETSKLSKSQGVKNKNQLTQQNSKSKSLIQQMLYKKIVKNTSQENYPVSNQSISRAVQKMQEEIEQLSQQAEKKQSTLRQNPSNHHLKSEINTINNLIEHCNLIIELYEDKVQLRTNIANLERDKMELLVENKDLKLKIHNPRDEEKKVKQELSYIKQQLEDEMRKKIKLENEIKSIIMVFKRLYDQADDARMLVIEKLRNVQERERRLNKMKFEVDPLESPIEVPEKLQKRPTLIETEEKKNYNPEISPVSNQMSYKKGETEKKTAPIPSKQKPENIKSVIPGKPTLEDQIKKMRNNQSAFSKFY